MVFISWGAAIVLAALGLGNLLGKAASLDDALRMFLMAATCFTAGLLQLPSAGYALWRLLGKRVVNLPTTLSRLHPGLWILASPLVIALGYWVSGIPGLAWLFLPPLHVLAVGLPVFWLLYLAVRNLPLGSPQRMWGVFGSGLIAGPLLILVAEGLAGLLFIILAILIVASRPELLNKISELSQWFMNNNPSPEMLLERLGPYLKSPLVMLSVMAFAAGLVPLIEEAFKPIGVWLLFGRKMSSSAGFAAGALSGAGYALFESLSITIGGQAWASVVVARIGTAVIHIFTAALVGWALVQAWQKRRYARLILAYLGAVVIHGLWNGLTVFVTLSSLGQAQDLQVATSQDLAFISLGSIGLGLLVVSTFIGLIWANRKMAIAHLAENLPSLSSETIQDEKPGEDGGTKPNAMET